MGVFKCCWFVLISYCLLQWCCSRVVMSDCVPPEEPIKCSSGNSDCTVTNSQGSFLDRSVCRAADTVYPSTEVELISAVAAATKNNREMKVYANNVTYIYSSSIYLWEIPQISTDLVNLAKSSSNKIVKILLWILQFLIFNQWIHTWVPQILPRPISIITT